MAAKIGIIGGSGLYEMPGLEGVKEISLDTPFGPPSDSYITGALHGKELVFLPRHGRGHKFPPSKVNFRANIYGMKKLGVERIISVSAVGSMKEEIAPGDIMIPDQFFDLTRDRERTFFSEGVVAHVAMADPICPTLSDSLYESGRSLGAPIHMGGTYLCIEGPQFSTRGESNIYRRWGVDVIGMTNMPEAKLAREAEICYATLALSTDYDCWHQTEEDVTVETIIQMLHQNVSLAQRIIAETVRKMEEKRDCSCAEALKNAIITSPQAIGEDARKRLGLLIGKYV